MNILYKEFYDAGYFDDFEILTFNQEYIRKAINPVNAIQAYFSKSYNDSIQLYIGNIQPMPIEITNLVLNDTISFSPLSEYIIAPKSRLRPAEYKVYTFKFSDNIEWSDKIIDPRQWSRPLDPRCDCRR